MTGIVSQLLPLDAVNSPSGSLRSLFGLDALALGMRMAEVGEPAWRGGQLAEAMYRQWITEIGDVTTLSRTLRRRLKDAGSEIGRPKIVQVFRSVDGTERYLVRGRDEQTVETVWMPDGDGGEAGEESSFGLGYRTIAMDADSTEEDARPALPARKNWTRATICVSSQVGCAVNCQFCLTAKLGLQRNLLPGEIAGQVVAVLERQRVDLEQDRINLVFMGMGEPFLNYDNFMAAVRLLVREVGLSPQRMTVSTAGIVPGIERFATESDEIRPRLAISLNAPNDALRNEVMPVNRKWPIAEIVTAVRKVPLRHRERITFEYVLLGGVTDQLEQASEVARIVRRTGVPAKVNLIAWNPGPGIHYSMPKPESVDAFRQRLEDEGIPAFIRRPRGRDIYAACGQLKRTVEG